MAAAVCQGSRSWSDPGFLLPRYPPVPFNLGLSSSYPFTGHSSDGSFLEAILTVDRCSEVDRQRLTQKQRAYVRTPIVNLELCTENLGNETGSDMSDSECAYSPSMKLREEQPLKPSKGETEKAKKYAGFPPPLTTIKGEEPVRYKTRHERGRLVLEAVKTSSANSIFRAKRSQGRLMLSFLDDSAPNLDSHVEEAEEHDIGNYKKEDEVEGDMDGVMAADIRTAETFKMPSRCKDGDHRRQLQHENRGLLNLNLGDIIIWSHLVNIRWIFLVALLSAIC